MADTSAHLSREEFTYVGKRGLTRKDGIEKTSGRAIFTRDVAIEGMAYAKPLLSPYAHAKIKSIDISEAEALPGVITVIKGYEDPEFKDIRITRSNLYRPADNVKNWLLFRDWADYWPEPLGVWVVAVSELIVDEALRLIRDSIEWEQLPIILDWNEAMEPGAPILRPMYVSDSNMAAEGIWEQGDVEIGFAEADQIIEFTQWKTPADSPAGVEPHSAVARWRGDRLEVWAHNKWLKSLKRTLHDDYNIALQNVQLNNPYQGGNFSYQLKVGEPNTLTEICQLIAKRAKRPVKAIFDTAHFNTDEESIGEYIFKVGFKNDGTVTAIQEESHYGFYSVGYATFRRLALTTKVPHLHSHCKSPFTAMGPRSCAKHGANATGMWMLTMNHVADELGMDPMEIGRINAGQTKDGELLDEAEMMAKKAEQGFNDRNSREEVYAAGKAAFGWDEKQHAPGAKILPNGKYHGVGFTSSYEWDHLPKSAVNCGLSLQWGTVRILSYNYPDIGTDPQSVYCRVAADEIGMKYDDVYFPNDVDYGFLFRQGSSSGGHVTNTQVIVKGARVLRKKILELATGTGQYWFISNPRFPDKTPQELDIKESVVFEKANPDNNFTLTQVSNTNSLGYSIFAEGWSTKAGDAYGGPPETDLWFDNPRDLVYYEYCHQAHFLEVEVDPETGLVEIIKLVNVCDPGKAFSPESTENQMNAVGYFGLGRSNCEGLFLDPQTGVKLNDNLLGYPLYVLGDIGPIENIIVETQGGFGPYGYVGCGESPVANGSWLTAPAVYNAIGIWVDLPTTPDKILKALGKG